MTYYNPTNDTYRSFETEWEKAEFLRENPEAIPAAMEIEVS
tara:strand:- start:64 stop:186 length:123 start_codon:yes stop_codon:yes gene_type:complete